MPGETVKLQVELVEKNAEAKLKALDKLAKEMGNRKITLNFDEASLARWKAATDGMTNAQLSAYAKMVTAAESANAKIIAAGQKSTQVEMQQNAKLVTERQKSIDKKIELYEKEDTKRRQIAEKTAQTEINANAKVQVATLKGVRGTRQQTQAQRELNATAKETDGIFSGLTSRFTAANLVSSLVTRGITLLRNALRQAVDEMKEMDKELTTIKMVTGASDSDISALRQQAFAGARETGRSTSDYLSAAERFARAGYRENIQDLTKLSLVTQNVGGVTEDVASKFILAADAAWKMGGNTERLWSMLDGVTSIADQNATDIGKIAEAYTVAGSAFANAGESERTFAALIGTTTAATQRSGSEMARGLQTILFRVRQVKGELDDGEIIDAASISNAAKALDSVGISVLNDANELKSFSEIMGELNEKWDTLNTKQKAYLQNALAGNRRGNVLFSLMDNWDVFEKQLEQFDESSGTALEKNEIYLDSWQAKTNELNTAWTNLIDTITDSGGPLQDLVSETAKFIDFINGGLKDFNEWYDSHKGQGLMGTPKDAEEWLADYLFGWMKPGPKGSGRSFAEESEESAEAQNSLAEATVQVIKTYNEEAEAVDALSEAFSKANKNIKDAADKMKDEKDSSIKSAADIYKAMQEAAQKGYYGSEAYKAGANLFFGTTDHTAITKEAQSALDAYFAAIANGDYSNAAANVWKQFSNKSGDIVDKTTGQVIASMKDVGDSYEWAFNKGNQSIDEFLQSMQASTGIGADFWASMIQSLGMYSDEMDQWMEDNKEMPEPEIKVQTDSAKEEVTSFVDEINTLLGGIEDPEIKVKITEDIQSKPVSDALDYVKDKIREISIAKGQETFVRKSKAARQREDKEAKESAEEVAKAWGEVPETVETKVEADTEAAISGAKAAKDALEEIPTKVNTEVSVSVSGASGSSGASGGGGGFPTLLYDSGSLIGNMRGLIGRAGGKHDNYSGIALVNDEFPADGSKPELIISKSQGRAYIANGGRPALVNLRSDDVVLTARETKSAFGIPGFAAGRSKTSGNTPKVTVKTPKSAPGQTGVGVGGVSASEAVDPTDNWNQLKKLIDYMVDEQKDILDDHLDVLDKQLKELEATRKEQKTEDELAQKQLKVDEALLDLEKAQVERTVRYYNESTGQWEWMADQGALAKAEEAYSDALKELNDFLKDLDFEEQKAAIQAQKDALQEAFDAYKEGWDLIVKEIEKPTGDLAALFEELKVNGTEAMKSQAGNIESLLGALETGFFTGIGDVTLVASSGVGGVTDAAASGITDVVNRAKSFLDSVKQDTNKTSSTSASAAKSSSGGGGGSSGSGSAGGTKGSTVMSSTSKKGISEMIEETVKTTFAQKATMEAVAEQAAKTAVQSVVSTVSKVINNNGNNTFINGVKIGNDQMSTPLNKVLANLRIQQNTTAR